MVVNISVFVKTEKIAYTAGLFEEYHGWAEPGTASSDAKWRIMKLTYNGDGLITDKQWYNKGTFNGVWDDRESLIYN